MFKSKLFQIIIAMLIVISLILVAFVALWNFMDKKNEPTDPAKQAQSSVEKVEGKKLSSAEVKDMTVIIKDVLTNLSEKNKVVKANFAFEMNSKKGKTEFENLDFKVKSVINQTLSDLTSEQITGSKGQDNLKSLLMNNINSLLTDGKIKQIWITEFIVQ